MVIRVDKVIANLPSTLEPNTFYAVRTGTGFDLYLSDATGSTAHAMNPAAAKQLMNNSGRMYMETTIGTRWVTDSDDNYGFGYYQMSEPSGDNRATPIVEYEHRGHIVPPNTFVKGLWTKARVNNISVPDVELALIAKQPLTPALAMAGINSDNEVEYETMYQGMWFADTAGNGVFSQALTGTVTHDHWKYFELNYQSPSDKPSELSIYARPSLQQTSRRYFLLNYGWDV